MKEEYSITKLVIYMLLTLSAYSFMFMCLWNWFIAPLGISKINFMWAGGIVIFLSFSLTPINSKEINFKLLFDDFITRTFTFFIGYVIHLYIGN